MKKIYIQPDMFPAGHEPKIIHEDEKGTYYYKEENVEVKSQSYKILVKLARKNKIDCWDSTCKTLVEIESSLEEAKKFYGENFVEYEVYLIETSLFMKGK